MSTPDSPGTVAPIDPEVEPIIDEIAAHHQSLTPLQRIAVATALEMLSSAARYAQQARDAGGYATTDRGARLPSTRASGTPPTCAARLSAFSPPRSPPTR